MGSTVSSLKSRWDSRQLRLPSFPFADTRYIFRWAVEDIWGSCDCWQTIHTAGNVTSLSEHPADERTFHTAIFPAKSALCSCHYSCDAGPIRTTLPTWISRQPTGFGKRFFDVLTFFLAVAASNRSLPKCGLLCPKGCADETWHGD